MGAGQLAEQFYRPDLIAQRLGPGGDKAVADAVQRLGDVRQVLAGGLPPTSSCSPRGKATPRASTS